MRRKTDLLSKPDHAKAVVNGELEKALKLFSEDLVRQQAIEKKKAEVAAKKQAEQ